MCPSGEPGVVAAPAKDEPRQLQLTRGDRTGSTFEGRCGAQREMLRRAARLARAQRRSTRSVRELNRTNGSESLVDDLSTERTHGSAPPIELSPPRATGRVLTLVRVVEPVALPDALLLHPLSRVDRVQLRRLAEQAAGSAVLGAGLALVIHRRPEGASAEARSGPTIPIVRSSDKRKA
jgi:uncharacterized protein YjiS (DUF1127 family)